MSDYAPVGATPAVAIPVAAPPAPPPGGRPPAPASDPALAGVPSPPAPKLKLRVPMASNDAMTSNDGGRTVAAAHVAAAPATAVAPPRYAPSHTGVPQEARKAATAGYLPPEERLCDSPFKSRALFSDDRAPIFSALLGGLTAVLVASVLWALVTVATHIQIGFMAWGVGILVGVGIRTTGDGARPAYGLLGAGLSLIGCVVGNIFAGCALLAKEFGDSFFDVLVDIGFVEPLAVLEMMFSPIDVLFYMLALITGYRLARGDPE